MLKRKCPKDITVQWCERTWLYRSGPGPGSAFNTEARPAPGRPKEKLSVKYRTCNNINHIKLELKSTTQTVNISKKRLFFYIQRWFWGWNVLSITIQMSAQYQHHKNLFVLGVNITDQRMFLSYLCCPGCVSWEQEACEPRLSTAPLKAVDCLDL